MLGLDCNATINEIKTKRGLPTRLVFCAYVDTTWAPKTETLIESVREATEKIAELKPSFMSVTYGAGGNTANRSTCEIASHIKNKCGIEAMAHLTCINSTRADIDFVLADLKANGIENILAFCSATLNYQFCVKFIIS